MTDWRKKKRNILKLFKTKPEKLEEVIKRVEKNELTPEDLELLQQAIDLQMWWQHIKGKIGR